MIDVFKYKPTGRNLLLPPDSLGAQRFGDVLGLCLIVEALRQQWGVEYRICPPNHYGWGQTRELVADYVTDTYDGYLEVCGDLWVMADIIHQVTGIVPKLNTPKKKKKYDICINPTLGNFYNADRNFSSNLIYRLLDRLRHIDKLAVIGLSENLGCYIDEFPNVHWILDDLDKSIEAVLSSQDYIGGDTGLSHLAGASSFYPKECVFIYGGVSEWRHNDIFQRNKNFYKEWVNIPDEFEPEGYLVKTLKKHEVIYMDYCGNLSNETLDLLALLYQGTSSEINELIES